MSNSLEQLLILVPLFIISISLHEAAHAYTAHFFGDDTAKREGRLTINPMAHLDILGTLMLVFFHFGWAKPVPVDSRNLKSPNWQMPVIAAAGPGSNLILAIISLVTLQILGKFPGMEPAQSVMMLSAWINTMLFVFNVLPLPPLDGAAIIRPLLSYEWQDKMDRFAPYGGLVLLVLIYLPFSRDALTKMIQAVLGILIWPIQAI